MKTPLLLLVLVAAVAAACLIWWAPTREYQPIGDGAVPTVLTKAVPAGYALRRVEVDGPCCTGCCEKLYAKLSAVEGLQQAAVRLDGDLATAEAIVPSAVTANDLAETLTFGKYTASAPN